MTAEVGERAPDFSLAVGRDKKISLADYRGKKPVVLTFFVLAFTGNEEVG